MVVISIEEKLEKCLSYMTEDNKEVFIACAAFPLKYFIPSHKDKESYTVEELKQAYRNKSKGILLITSINEIEEALGID